jgi:type VI secretion system protein ImpF
MSGNKVLFMPVLLDRLTDEFPDRRSETRKIGISRTEYYNAVIRDISWLLNSTQFEADLGFELPPRVKDSTLNYGLVPISGRRFSELDLPEIAESIKHAITTFETRILAETISVVPFYDPVSQAHNLAVFEISAKLWFEPSPIDLRVRTELDMEAGHAIVVGR